MITAAHCISGGTSYRFYTGPGTLETVTLPTEAIMDSLPNVTKHAVASVGVYPGASLATTPYTHDVAYVELAQPIIGVAPGDDRRGAARQLHLPGGRLWLGEPRIADRAAQEGRARRARRLIDDAIDVDVIIDTGIADRGDSGGPLICNGATIGTFSWIDNYLSETATRRYARLDGAVRGVDRQPHLDDAAAATAASVPGRRSVRLHARHAVIADGVGDADRIRLRGEHGAEAWSRSTPPRLSFVSIEPGATQADADRTARSKRHAS